MKKKISIVFLLILIVGMVASTVGVVEDVFRIVNTEKDSEIITTAPTVPEPPPIVDGEEKEIWTDRY